MAITGVDVSHWQGAIDWGKLERAGAEFAFIRSAIGTSGMDRRFLTNWRDAKNTSLLLGTYFVYKPELDPVDQAEHFASSATFGGDRMLMTAYDIELPTTMSPEENGKRIKESLDHFELITGRTPIIYTGAWYWDSSVARAGWETDYPLWVANYRGEPTGDPVIPVEWHDWLIWQYTNKGDGSLYGVSSSAIDLNFFRGERSDLVSVFSDFERNTIDRYLKLFAEDSRCVDINYDAALYKEIQSDGYFPVGNERGDMINCKKIIYQLAQSNLGGVRVYYVVDNSYIDVFYVDL